jgi:hypothetical protein
MGNECKEDSATSDLFDNKDYSSDEIQGHEMFNVIAEGSTFSSELNRVLLSVWTCWVKESYSVHFWRRKNLKRAK